MKVVVWQILLEANPKVFLPFFLAERALFCLGIYPLHPHVIQGPVVIDLSQSQ